MAWIITPDFSCSHSGMDSKWALSNGSHQRSAELKLLDAVNEHVHAASLTRPSHFSVQNR